MIKTIVDKEILEEIKAGKRKVDFRLNDEKCSSLKRGHVLVFSDIDSNLKVKTRVSGLYYAHTFAELRTILVREGLIDFKDFDPQKMLERYSSDEIYKCGVVGIKYAVVEEDKRKTDPVYRSAPGIVAEYILDYKTVEKYPEGRWICARPREFSLRDIVRKLKRTFTPDILYLMAYHIKTLSGEIEKEEFQNVMNEYSLLSPDELLLLLECSKRLAYRVWGYRKTGVRDYLV